MVSFCIVYGFFIYYTVLFNVIIYPIDNVIIISLGLFPLVLIWLLVLICPSMLELKFFQIILQEL
jgi:hypothetical protein